MKPIWYPIIAIPLLLLSVGTTLLAGKLLKSRERRDLFHNGKNTKASGERFKIPLINQESQFDTDIEGGCSGSTVSEPSKVFSPINNTSASSAPCEFPLQVIQILLLLLLIVVVLGCFQLSLTTNSDVLPEYLEPPLSDFDPEQFPHYLGHGSRSVSEG